MLIPEDCVSEILAYLPECVVIRKEQRRHHPKIRDYLDALRLAYTSRQLRYLNYQYQRQFARRPGRPWRQKLSLRSYLEESHIMPGPDGLCKSKAMKHYKHTCCALTHKGTRCIYKTFNLFCGKHKGSTICYWT